MSARAPHPGNLHWSDWSDDAKRRAARAYAREAFALGLAVTGADGARAPIPAVLTPAILTAAELGRRREVARCFAEAIAQVARALLSASVEVRKTEMREAAGGPTPRPKRSAPAGVSRATWRDLARRAELLLAPLTPLERRVITTHGASPRLVPNARVDFFPTREGGLKALELNATIPAMQGYSDIAARALISAVGEARGLGAPEIARLIAKNPSNARALLDALLAAYAARGGAGTPRIALCARRGDAQLSELEYLAAQFNAWGAPAAVVFADEIGLAGNAITAGAMAYDVLYRHIFAWRVDPASPLAEVLTRGHALMVFNPVDPELESKLTLAELSRALDDDALAAAYGLLPEARAALCEVVPWTRILNADLPEGGALIAEVAAAPKNFVLKRSWDYGGKAVFIGREHESPAAQARCLAVFGEALDWPALVARAARDTRGGGFVAQALVDSPRRVVTIVDAGGACAEAEVFIDYSAFVSLGAGAAGVPWSGVCRASASSIVNIAGGGGLQPILDAEVAQALGFGA